MRRNRIALSSTADPKGPIHIYRPTLSFESPARVVTSIPGLDERPLQGQGADADPLKAYMWVELASKRSTGPLKEKCLEFLAHLAERLAPAGVEGEARTEDIPFFGALERERRLGPLR